MAGAARKTKLKTEQFNKQIEKRGIVPPSDREKAKGGFKVGPLMLAFFLFVVAGSAVLQIISAAQRGLPGL